MLSGTLHKSCQSCPWGLNWPRPGGHHNGKNDVHFFSAVLDRFLFILADNDNIHESLDEFEIRLDPNSGFHGNRL